MVIFQCGSISRKAAIFHSGFKWIDFYFLCKSAIVKTTCSINSMVPFKGTFLDNIRIIHKNHKSNTKSTVFEAVRIIPCIMCYSYVKHNVVVHRFMGTSFLPSSKKLWNQSSPHSKVYIEIENSHKQISKSILRNAFHHLVRYHTSYLIAVKVKANARSSTTKSRDRYYHLLFWWSMDSFVSI